jgi:type IV pilus assembly protein PilC
MAEFKIEGMTVSGKPVSGVINAENYGLAKKRAYDLASAKKFKVRNVRQRVTYLYRVQRGSDKPIDGEQKAFSKQEVEDALRKMGLQVIYVRRKLFDFKPKPPMTEIVTFVRVSADLIRQKLPYNEVLQMMVNDITNNTLRDTVRDINNELKQGRIANKYIKNMNVFSDVLHRICSDSHRSRVTWLRYTIIPQNFLSVRMQFRKDLKSALIMPSITVVATFAALLYFVMYIFPETARLFVQMKIDLPPLTAGTLAVANWLTANIFWILYCSLLSHCYRSSLFCHRERPVCSG